jgi:hypothetical protein
MVSVESRHLKHAKIENKFICVSAPVEIGSLIDGWKVAWCMPDERHETIQHRLQPPSHGGLDDGGEVRVGGGADASWASARKRRSSEA